jgi:hypothetical protein
MKTVYTVYGQDDGVIGIFSSWSKATDSAKWYCGNNTVEDTTKYGDDEPDRNWDIRNFSGDNSSAHIQRWHVQ